MAKQTFSTKTIIISITIELLLILTIGFYKGCVYKHMAHFEEDDLKWVYCYNVGDTSIFISNYGNIDTLIITEMKNNDKFKRIIPNEGHSNVFEPSASYKYKIFNKSNENRDTLDGIFIIKKKFYENVLSFTASLDKRNAFDINRFNRQNEEYSNILSKFAPIDTMQGNYLIFDNKNSRYSKYWLDKVYKIDVFIINKNIGLIYYKFENGEEFIRELINN